MKTKMLCGAALMGGATQAHAHLMPAGHGTINLVGDKAYVVMSVPVSAFSNVDTCSDGVLTQAELQSSEDALRSEVNARVVLHGAGSFQPIHFDLETGPDHGGTDIIVMAVATVSHPEQPLELRSSLWTQESGRLQIRATVSEGRRTLRSEVVALTPTRPSAVFFSTPGRG